MRWIVLLAMAGWLPAQEPALERLQKEVERLAQASGGVVGVTALHVESGRRVSLRGGEGFPMASTVKVPLAVQLLSLVDEGKLRLDTMVSLEPKDLHPGSGTLSDLFRQPGVSLSIRNLMELMLLISDNSATDVLLRIAGGGEAVNARLRALGIAGVRVDRPTALLIADGVGYRDRLPAEEDWTQEAFRKASRATSREERARAVERFQDDPRDTATPDGMAALLLRIHKRDILKPDSAALLLDILERCRTGGARLKGLLPAGTVVAHKTGSMPMVANDVGIVTLPGDAGHVVMAAFTKKFEDTGKGERAIAEIARATHDFFVFQPKGAVDYAALADRMVQALAPKPGERYFARPDDAYFLPLAHMVRERMRAAKAVETASLDEAQMYLWLPLRPGGPGLPQAERDRVKRWTDLGGARRQLHFHWGEGSVYTDGLYGEHTAALDALYEQALRIDYKALSAAQDKVIAQLRSGAVRVRTAAGTDISFRIGDRPFNKQDGDASAARAQRARTRIDRDIELPAGVVRVAPLEETVNGVMVIPEARVGNETARGIRLTFAKGVVTKVEARENLAAVEAYLKPDAARRFREFAIGLNPALAPQAGSQALPYYGYGHGVVRLSLGDNEEVGGKVRGGFVRWFFFPTATVEVNNRALALSVN